MGYSGAGGKLIHKKTRSKKSRDTVPLSCKFSIVQYNSLVVYQTTGENDQSDFKAMN